MMLNYLFYGIGIVSVLAMLFVLFQGEKYRIRTKQAFEGIGKFLFQFLVILGVLDVIGNNLIHQFLDFSSFAWLMIFAVVYMCLFSVLTFKDKKREKELVLEQEKGENDWVEWE